MWPIVRFQLPDELIFLKNRKMPQKLSTALMNGQVVVITGATSGVGYQAVQQLAKAQAQIVMINRNAEKSVKLQQQLQSDYGVIVDVVLADFSNPKQTINGLKVNISVNAESLKPACWYSSQGPVFPGGATEEVQGHRAQGNYHSQENSSGIEECQVKRKVKLTQHDQPEYEGQNISCCSPETKIRGYNHREK
jgi:hypothetical protein